MAEWPSLVVICHTCLPLLFLPWLPAAHLTSPPALDAFSAPTSAPPPQPGMRQPCHTRHGLHHLATNGGGISSSQSPVFPGLKQGLLFLSHHYAGHHESAAKHWQYLRCHGNIAFPPPPMAVSSLKACCEHFLKQRVPVGLCRGAPTPLSAPQSDHPSLHFPHSLVLSWLKASSMKPQPP